MSTVNRSSKTGRFVASRFAKKHKATTQTEVVKRKGNAMQQYREECELALIQFLNRLNMAAKKYSKKNDKSKS